jgi:hypothetical protein
VFCGGGDNGEDPPAAQSTQLFLLTSCFVGQIWVGSRREALSGAALLFCQPALHFSFAEP